MLAKLVAVLLVLLVIPFGYLGVCVGHLNGRMLAQWAYPISRVLDQFSAGQSAPQELLSHWCWDNVLAQWSVRAKQSAGPWHLA